jgi:hypothetical protein
VCVGAMGETTWRFGVPFCTNLHVREEEAVAVVGCGLVVFVGG